MPDVMQAWRLASQSNHDDLLSSIPAVLALLLRTLSNTLELSSYGVALGRSLLLKSQQDLIARGLTSAKTKDFVISPALRLLREVTIFDGGVLAKLVFRARDKVFQGLVRNLNLRWMGEGVESYKKPSIRTNALRFILPLIKFLPGEVREELLSQRDILSALTKDMKDDPHSVVREILDILKNYVLLDRTLRPDVKFKVLNGQLFGRIYPLYQYAQPEEESKGASKPIDELAHEFLLVACTSSDLGILNRQSGLYPRGVNPDDVEDADTDDSFIDLGLDSIDWMDKYTEKVPVRNVVLSDFIQMLRPFASIKQGELLLAILKAAPELTADYFYRKKSFSLEPKLTATWIGYSAFIFSSLQLPIPKYFGHKERYARAPPPPAIVLESILPQPLTQKVLSRCLNLQGERLITFFAIRILCLALEKLQSTLRMYHEAEHSSSALWSRAADRLVDEFCQRFLSMDAVILAYRRMDGKDVLQKEAITKLLVLYYEVVPRIARDTKSDASASLAENLKTLEEEDANPQDRALRLMERENIFLFAHFSPRMRWFTVPDGQLTSPFMAMLMLCSKAQSERSSLKLRTVLNSVIVENQILQLRTTNSALDSLIVAMQCFDGRVSSPPVYKFIDDCISRCAKKPIKYILALEDVTAEVHEASSEHLPVSLLLLTIADQWPFLVKAVEAEALQAISKFVARYMAASVNIEEDSKVIDFLSQKIAAQTPKGSAREVIEGYRSFTGTIHVPVTKLAAVQARKEEKYGDLSEAGEDQTALSMEENVETPAEDYDSLVKWATKDVDEVVEDGYLASLILLLSSEHLSVRKEAATNILKFAAKVKASDFEEKEQIWLLLCEVVETAKMIVENEPLPTYISAFAYYAVAVLNDPLHYLYPKINAFLSGGPIWEVSKIPLMHKILDEGPSHDDCHYLEMGWLLTYMLVGLRTKADMTAYQKKRVFEKLLTIYNNAYLPGGLRGKILRIFFKATKIGGGTNRLVTRVGSMTWLQAQVALGGCMPLKVLMETMLATCDQIALDKWSKRAKRAKAEILSS